MNTGIETATQDGFETITLGNHHLSLTVVPGLGAKLISLITRGSQRQWLWRSGRTPQLFDVPIATPFDQGPLLGADECIPTVAPCRWQGRALPDHGEAWSAPWTVDRASLVAGELRTSIDLPITPLRFTRSIRLDGATIRFAYTLENIGSQHVDYLWAFHPLLTWHEGDRIVLPAEVDRLRTEFTLGDLDLGPRGAVRAWPQPRQHIDLARGDLGGPGRATKIYTEPLQAKTVEAAVVNDVSGDRLALRFTTGQIESVGVWLNRGGFGGYEHFAIEPASGAPDALDVAASQWKRCRRIEPGKTCHWALAISVDGPSH